MYWLRRLMIEMAKKKDEEDDLPLYLWLRSYTKKLVPPRPLSMIPIKRSKSSFSWAQNQLPTPSWKTGTKISSKGPGLSVGQQAAFFLQQNSLRGGAFPAYMSYGKAGLLDPKAPVEAYGYGGFLGFSGWKRGVVGALVGGIIGFSVGGMVLTAIDPLHKWEGGYDETAEYQQNQRDYAEMKAPWKAQYMPTA